MEGVPTVVLGTAHPAKFTDAVESATNVSPALPAFAAHIMEGEEKIRNAANNLAAIQAIVDNSQ